jgi:hypothetical protein
MLLTILVDLQFKDDESSFIDKTRQDQLHCKEIKHDLGYPYTFVHFHGQGDLNTLTFMMNIEIKKIVNMNVIGK